MFHLFLVLYSAIKINEEIDHAETVKKRSQELLELGDQLGGGKISPKTILSEETTSMLTHLSRSSLIPFVCIRNCYLMAGHSRAGKAFSQRIATPYAGKKDQA